ncbi:MAG: HlyD family type I secretion periplasmic adaptor subunit [Candidatus Altimarinota bacterium]
MQRNENGSWLFTPVTIIIGTLLIIVIPVLYWSKQATLEQVSRANGIVIASGKTQSIQTAIDGVINKVLVKEGEYVNEGKEIVLLDKIQTQAAFDSSFAKVAALNATLVRVKSEVYGKELLFSDEFKEYPEFVSAQTALFKRKQKALNDEIGVLKESLSILEEELKLNRSLLKSGDIGKVEINKLKRQIIDIKGQITNKQNKYFQDSLAELTKVEEELSTKLQELEDKRVTLEHSSITAPVNAIVKNILITTQGAKVRPGDVILELVPSNDKLIIEAKFNPKELSFIKLGQKAAIKLDAYDYSIYGIFSGKVSYISPDSLSERTDKGEEFYFRVQIELDNKELTAKNGKKIELTPGMSASIDIITGERTVFDYLTKPIVKTISESFQER